MRAPGVFTEHTGPILDALKRIHRGGDGYIRFMKASQDGGLGPIRSIQRDRLKEGFPLIRNRLTTDAYFSINAFWKGATGKDKDLRYLNAVYSDCDVRDLRINETLGLAINAQDGGAFPPASAIVRSGRGIWLLWLLVREDDAAQPETAFPEQRRLYSKIEQAINEKLKALCPGLKPDPRALDTTRVTRLEGSFHTIAGRRVSYWWQADDTGEGYSYTLRQLARFFGVTTLNGGRPKRQESGHSGRRVPNRRRGQIAVNEKLLHDLRILEQARDGMPQDCRYWGALALATVLRKLSRSPREIEKEIQRYAGRCRPPLAPGEQRRAIKGAESGLKWTGRRLAANLEVEQQEADRLGLSIIRPDLVPFREIPRTPRKAQRVARRAAILEIAKESPGVCGVDDGRSRGVREVARRLEARGIKASIPAVSRDIKALTAELPDPP